MRRRLFDFPWRTRRRITEDVERELAFHMESRVQELMSLGAAEDDALAQARREFGDVDDARRYMVRLDREIENTHRRRDHMRELWQDIRYALRRMRSAPVFTATAVATLAIGIGANTAVFSVVEAALMRPLPYPTAERVLSAYTLAPWGPFSTSPADFLDWRANARGFAAMAGVVSQARTVTGVGEPVSVEGAYVTEDFFTVLGVTPALGRAFSPEEMQYGGANAVILSHGFWTRAMGSDPSVVGRSITLDAESYTIAGVMPPGFTYPGRAEMWSPLTFNPATVQSQRGAHYLDVLGLLAPGATLELAQGELKRVAKELETAYPNTNKNYSAEVAPLRDALVGSTPRRALIVLFGAVALVALIACANVANLVLARGTSREREMAVRVALGASPRDLLYMALTESVLLALFGGAAGLLLAAAMTGTLDYLRPESLREMGALEINAAAAAFTFLLSFIAGIFFGLAPGIQASRNRALQPALAAGGRAEAGERHTNRLRSTLVSAELALAVVLLSGAGLLIKSFTRLQQVDVGFDPTNMLVFRLSLPEAQYDSDDRLRLAYEDALNRVRSVPGVASAGAIMLVPLAPGSFSISTRSLDGVVIPSDEQPSTQIRIVLPGTFPALGVQLKSGRTFTDADQMGAEKVVILNESAARLLFPGVDPIGHEMRIGTRFTSDTTRAGGRIVGVVADIRDAALGREPRPTTYLPHAQNPAGTMSFMVRAAEGMNPMSLVESIKPQIAAVDPLLPVINPRTMDDVVARSVAQPRFATLLMSVFAGFAVLLALIGVFGVMAYIVGQRSREIGIRMALGATQKRVVAETLRRTFAPLGVGVVLGVVGTIWLVRVIAGLLYDVAPRDPWVLGSVAAGLVAVALVAAWIPARRASTVDPLAALRSD